MKKKPEKTAESKALELETARCEAAGKAKRADPEWLTRSRWRRLSMDHTTPLFVYDIHDIDVLDTSAQPNETLYISDTRTHINKCGAAPYKHYHAVDS